MDVEEKIKKIEESLKNRATTNMLSEMRKDIENRIEKIMMDIESKNSLRGNEIEALRKEIESLKNDIKNLEKSNADRDEAISLLRNYFLKYEKLHKRLKNIEEVIGIEEEINVNKIPPSILRLVYQYTLNDAISSLRKYVGVSEAERIIKIVLQDVRTRTSGTELFKFSEGRIEAKDIERAIKKKLISPKQIHLTYLEIMNKIREYIPGYIPKNFASLLRTKGQEYAIETSTENRLRVEMIEHSFERLRNEMAYQENIIREDLTEVKRMLEMDIRNTASEIKGRIDEIENNVKGLNDEITKLYDILGKFEPYFEMIRREAYQNIKNAIPEGGMKVSDLDYPQQIINDFINEEMSKGTIILKDDFIYDVEKIKNKILDVLGKESMSFSALFKETGYDKDILDTVLKWMTDENILEERKYGKGRKYKRR